MHVWCLTDIDNVLVFDEGAKYLEKCCDIEELRRHIKDGVVLDGLVVKHWVFSYQYFQLVFNEVGNTPHFQVLSLEVDDVILATNLILRYNFHDDVLVDVVTLVVEDHNNAEEV